jgi:hypothetical protein
MESNEWEILERDWVANWIDHFAGEVLEKSDMGVDEPEIAAGELLMPEEVGR